MRQDIITVRKDKAENRRQTGGEPRYFSAQISEARRFYLTWNFTTQRSLVVVSGGVEHCRSDYEINRSGFPHPTLEFVARGAGQLVLNGQTHALDHRRRVCLWPGWRRPGE